MEIRPNAEKIFESSTGETRGLLFECSLIVTQPAYDFIYKTWFDFYQNGKVDNESTLETLNQFLEEEKSKGEKFLYWSKTRNEYLSVTEFAAIYIEYEILGVVVAGAKRQVKFVNVCSFSDLADEEELKQKYGSRPHDLEFGRYDSLKNYLPYKEQRRRT